MGKHLVKVNELGLNKLVIDHKDALKIPKLRHPDIIIDDIFETLGNDICDYAERMIETGSPILFLGKYLIKAKNETKKLLRQELKKRQRG